MKRKNLEKLTHEREKKPICTGGWSREEQHLRHEKLETSVC
jgi:hypothetical protein